MIEVIDDLERFRTLRSEWTALLASSVSETPFLTWEWLFTWWKHLGGSRRLSILTLRSGGELIAIAPLALRPPQVARLLPFHCLEFLGTGSVGSDYLDLIVSKGREPEALRVLADDLTRRGMMLELAQVRREASLAGRLAETIQERGWDVRRTGTFACPFIPLAGHTWESYLGTLGPAHRANVLRRLRRLSRHHEVRFEEARTEERRREFLRHLIDLHQRRWSDLGGSEAFYLAGLVAFHDEFSALALLRGWLRLFLLCLDDSPAAAFYGFRLGTTFFFYQSGFDPAFSGHSVGLVAMGLALKRAIEEGAAEFDMLHGEENYKFLWAREVRNLERLEVYPPRLRGAVRRGVVEVGRNARHLARRVVPQSGGGRRAPTAPRTAGGTEEKP